jgi:hypothetical protein
MASENGEYSIGVSILPVPGLGTFKLLDSGGAWDIEYDAVDGVVGVESDCWYLDAHVTRNAVSPSRASRHRALVT